MLGPGRLSASHILLLHYLNVCFIMDFIISSSIVSLFFSYIFLFFFVRADLVLAFVLFCSSPMLCINGLKKVHHFLASHALHNNNHNTCLNDES